MCGVKPKALGKRVDNYHDFDQTCVGGSSECSGMMCHVKSCNVHSSGNTVVAPPACHYRGAGIPLHLLSFRFPVCRHSNTSVPLHHLPALLPVPAQRYGRTAVLRTYLDPSTATAVRPYRCGGTIAGKDYTCSQWNRRGSSKAMVFHGVLPTPQIIWAGNNYNWPRGE